MSQISLKKLTTDWTAFSDIKTPVADTLYFIQNRGSDYLISCEGDTEPTTDSGIIIPPNGVLKYKVGSQNLYLRAHSTTCSINVSDEG